MICTNRIALGLVLLGTVAAVTTRAAAEDYPTKPINFIVSSAAGGAVDILARTMAEKLTESLGQPVVVEDKPGANGVIASEYVANAAPDGYTLLVTYEAHTVNPYLMDKLPYDTLQAFRPVSLLASNPMLLVVTESLPVKSLSDLVALAKSKPGELNSAHFGSSMLIPLKLLNTRAGIDVVPVPYKDRATATTDLLEGRVQMMFSSVVSILPYTKDGSLRAIAVTTADRSPALADVPTISESGFKDYAFNAWNGILAPAGTPDAVIEKLHAEIVKALASADVQERLGTQTRLVGSTPAEFETVIKDELVKWADLGL